jgi:hypothetical protein
MTDKTSALILEHLRVLRLEMVSCAPTCAT